MRFDDKIAELILNSYNSDKGLVLNPYNNSYMIGCTSIEKCMACELYRTCGSSKFEELALKLIKENYPEYFI